MRLNGFSYKGCYHPENQDAFLCIRGENDRFAMAVSDGLGSKKKSALGAAAFCRSVERLFRAGDALWAEQIPAVLHGMWLEELGDAAPDECNATGLFALWQGGVFTLGALGDGIAAAQMIDGQTMVLFDAKEEYFLNETDCPADDTTSGNCVAVYGWNRNQPWNGGDNRPVHPGDDAKLRWYGCQSNSGRCPDLGQRLARCG